MSGFKEKRKHERFDYDAPIEHAEIDSGEFIAARMGNYSRSGMRFDTAQALVSGDDICIKLEENPPPLYDLGIYDDCWAQIKWCRASNDLPDHRFSVGIQYYTPMIAYSRGPAPAGTPDCPKCGTENGREATLCTGCGYDLAKVTPVFLEGQPDPKSYTPKNIAAKMLAALPQIRGKKRPATALFTDLCGFRSLAESCTLQDLHQIMDGYFQILMNEVYTRRGIIARFTADGVLAFFGSPLSLSDHSKQACEAAIAIQNALHKYGRHVHTRFGLDLKARIGLNAGPIVIDAIGDDLRIGYMAAGDTTRLAARLESLADPEKILVSVNVYDRVKQDIHCDHLGKVYVKGREEPVYIYEIDDTPSKPA
jgi:class 3 adenylate cyclase